MKTVEEVSSVDWEPPNNYVDIRGVIIFDMENKVKRAGFDLLEGIFADVTGSMPISIWSDHIDSLSEATDIVYEIKGISVKMYKGALRFTTGSSTSFERVPAKEAEKSLNERYANCDVDIVHVVEGTVQLIKDFNCGTKCKFCSRRMIHPITLKKIKCNACGALQLTAGNVCQMSITIVVDEQRLTLHDNVIDDSVLPIVNLYDEEELSEAILGKTVSVRYRDNVALSLHILPS